LSGNIGTSIIEDGRVSGPVVAAPLATSASIVVPDEIAMAGMTGNTSARVSPGIIRMGMTMARTPDCYDIPFGQACPSLIASLSSAGRFSDAFTFTGSTARLLVNLAVSFDGRTDIGDNGMSARVDQGFGIEALASDNLVLLDSRFIQNGQGFWDISNSCDFQSNGNRRCGVGATLIRGTDAQGSFAGRTLLSFEIDNGATVFLRNDLEGSLFANGFTQEGWPRATLDMDRTAVFEGFSGNGLTGITSASLGALSSVGGVFAYEDVHALNAAVPEPASWAMLIAGFGLVGAVLRRRRHAGARQSAQS
jgi:hypothetical protein